MKKWILVASLAALLGACGQEKGSDDQLKPNSLGQLGEIVVITDIVSLDSAYKEAIKEVFGATVPGFPPPGEASFRIKFTDETYFRGYFKTHHNIFILLTAENLRRMKETYGENNLAAVQKVIATKGALGWKQEDVWAQNQTVFYVTAASKADMLEKLKRRSSELLNMAFDHERETGAKKLYRTSATRDTFYTGMLDRRGYALRKPSAFRVALTTNDFVWLRKSVSGKEQEFGVLIYEVPYVKEEQLNTEELIAIRNTFTQRYIPGEYEGSYMKYSEVFPPVRRTMEYQGRYCADIRGWWDMHGDFMGGPSTIRAIVDEKLGKIVFFEGFLFYPNERKAKAMRELDLILNTVSFKE